MIINNFNTLHQSHQMMKKLQNNPNNAKQKRWHCFALTKLSALLRGVR